MFLKDLLYQTHVGFLQGQLIRRSVCLFLIFLFLGILIISAYCRLPEKISAALSG